MLVFKMLIDTSVWLDIAKDQKQEPVLGVIEEMVKMGLLTTLVPRIVLDEFRRSRDRIAQQSANRIRRQHSGSD
jgi:predicted nucleic acid-binding protein